MSATRRRAERARAPPSLRRRAQPLSALRPLLERLHSAWRRAPPAKDCLPRVSDGGEADRARAGAEQLEEGELRTLLEASFIAAPPSHAPSCSGRRAPAWSSRSFKYSLVQTEAYQVSSSPAGAVPN